tara:strand:- start:1443 stop:1808 length:366 start_codon:yes stop_codon:yes gene_type:complete
LPFKNSRQFTSAATFQKNYNNGTKHLYGILKLNQLVGAIIFFFSHCIILSKMCSLAMHLLNHLFILTVAWINLALTQTEASVALPSAAKMARSGYPPKPILHETKQISLAQKSSGAAIANH